VRVLNDANAFALAEARCGAGRGAQVVLGLTLGTGVGGGIVIGGRLHTGAHGFAGEVGHVSLERDGPPCACGNRGCLETFVGNRAIVARYLELSGGPSARVLEGAGGRVEAITPEAIHQAALAGEAAARATFQRTGEILGIALAGLANVLDPDVIVLGGGVSQAGEMLLAPARRLLRERCMIPEPWLPEIRTASLGPEAAVVGAALEALGIGPD
jgi:glucokinase